MKVQENKFIIKFKVDNGDIVDITITAQSVDSALKTIKKAFAPHTIEVIEILQVSGGSDENSSSK